MHPPPLSPRRVSPRRVSPGRLSLLAFAVSLLLASVASAQEPARIEQQMTPEQFKAAGLDQLDAQQLANLNDWLNRTLDTETTKAAQQAETRVNHQNRGFGGSASSEPIEARLQGPFSGFGKGRSYTLDNGQVWRQTDSATLHGVKLDNPQIKITPGLFGSVWFLQVEGYNTRAKVQRSK